MINVDAEFHAAGDSAFWIRNKLRFSHPWVFSRQVDGGFGIVIPALSGKGTTNDVSMGDKGK